MDDVKNQPQATQEPVETPTEQPSQVAEQPAETPVVETPNQAPVERTVPLTALQEERKRRQELQRELAEARSRNQVVQGDPDEYDAWLSNPQTQELMIKVAKQELQDHARGLLDQYPQVPELVKKAILKNVRGFVSESTTDTETAKLDIQQYVEDVVAEVEAGSQEPAPAKGFPVAPTNLPATETGNKSNAAEVEKILNKPVDEWTEEEAATATEYSKKYPKK